MKKVCLVCSKEFTTYPNWIKRGGGKFCSWKCSAIAKEKDYVKRICGICSKEFLVKPSTIKYSKAIYCSHACMHKGHIGRKKPIGNKARNWRGGVTLIQKYCLDCGVKLGDHRSMRCQKCAYDLKLHHNWNNGSSYLPYPLQFNRELKDKIRQRDNYICQLCNITEEEHLIVYGKNLTVHHVDYNKENCGDDNLTTLCGQCNFRVNYNRTYWTDFFKSRILSKMEG